jgi:hypothetical protein
MDPEAQKDQLQTLARAQRINFAPVNKLPDDTSLKVSALATLLEVDPMAGMRGDVPIIGQIARRGYTQTGGEVDPVSFQFGNGILQPIGLLIEPG